jgi:hypothetical protein
VNDIVVRGGRKPQICRELGGALIAIGSVLALSGVVMNASLESLTRAQFVPLDELNLRAMLSLVLLLLGLLAAFVGSIVWAATKVPKTLKSLGGFILACSLLGLFTTPLNVHNWTFTLALVYITALLVGAVFLLLAYRPGDRGNRGSTTDSAESTTRT